MGRHGAEREWTLFNVTIGKPLLKRQSTFLLVLQRKHGEILPSLEETTGIVSRDLGSVLPPVQVSLLNLARVAVVDSWAAAGHPGVEGRLDDHGKL